MKIEEHVQNLPFWNLLDEDEKQFVRETAVVRTMKKGTVILNSPDACLGALQIIKGLVRVMIISEEGREITLMKVSDGDYCILSASCVLSQITFETQMVALEDTEVLLVNAGAFAKLMEMNLKVKCHSYEQMVEKFSEVMWVMQEVLFARIDQRIAGFLLKEYEKTGNPEVKITQEGLAQEINTAREVVARMLAQFASEDLVEIKRGRIIIKDAKGLEMLT